MRRTQRAIKQALTERYYSWRDAEAIAKSDPEVDLSGDGPVYTPSIYLEEDVAGEEAGLEMDERLEPVRVASEMKPEQRPSPSA